VTWGVEGYDVLPFYEDPVKSIKDRDLAKIPKGTKSMKLITKRGHFIDDYVRQYKYIPHPAQYDIVKPWAKLDVNAPKRSVPANRDSLFDQIVKHEKRRGFPGVGKYNVIMTDAEVKAKVADMKKRKQG
jgi:hypothetical protein